MNCEYVAPCRASSSNGLPIADQASTSSITSVAKSFTQSWELQTAEFAPADQVSWLRQSWPLKAGQSVHPKHRAWDSIAVCAWGSNPSVQACELWSPSEGRQA